MIFELPNEPYHFTTPPDSHWLPSPYAMFFEEEPEYVPSPKLVRQLCEEINSKWDDKEKYLRRLRAEAACEFGICRNF